MTQIDVTANELSARFLNVHESQAVFRLLLDSLSRPGEVFHLPAELVGRIPPVEIPLLAVLGYDTPFSVIDGDATCEQLISRATSGRIVPYDEAAYICVLNPLNSLLPLGFSLGTALRPDFAAQVVVQISGIFTAATEETSTFVISGPGVETVNHVACTGVQEGQLNFLLQRIWSAPRGTDLWLVGVDGSLVGVPRTSEVTPGAHWDKENN
jgi:alpha-D-ribose 1-methylphosphonate 5-triphosphate synthase subunit PhnH